MLGRSVFAACLVITGTAGAADYAPGEKLTLFNCGRCHVVNEKNRYGGIGSTPSFAAMRSMEDWEDRFKAFWTLAPHPAFTQIEDMTEPFPPHRPSPIHPLLLTLDEVDVIIEYSRTIAPKDLGNEIR